MKTSSFYRNQGTRRRHAGYTLVELSITVSIIAVLLVGSLVGVQRLLDANKVNNTLSQTTVSIANIAKVQSSIGSTALSTANLAPLGVWDRSIVTNTGTTAIPVYDVKNPFAGSIQVAANTAAVGTILANKGYFYRISNVPESSCASLAAAFYTSAQGIYINATTTSVANAGNTPATTVGYRVPGSADSLANLTTACASGAGTNGVVEIALFIPV